MADIPTPEESGQQILGIFRANRRRCGEMMLVGALLHPFLDRGWREEDFFHGIKWLLDQGYVKEEPGKGGMYFLTDAGCQEM